ncbi:hypothetical protein EVJ58_g9091 [Rhodofomes roseus]|uniref:Uncharacterized protein n=1 Tax=Rhodofomes roseus TaxID=34475 RepID=A0A4Y9XWA2_9APHY|nr:hypothetical protein EVJ58_g9091 [Rhodofomes roseus]
MVQCVACEDWFHESCLNLRERPPERASTPEDHNAASTDEDHNAASTEDDASDASDDLPLALITADDYDSFVCGACVRGIPTLRQYAGTPGALMVVRDAPGQPWKIIGREESTDGSATVEVTEGTETEESDVGEKRARSADEEEVPSAKRPRVSTEPLASPPCLAPPANPVAQKTLDSSSSEDLGAGDVFLTEGWRERWCKCESRTWKCLPSLQARQYLLEEEETYEPPEDPDSGLSLEELGLRALQHLPRERAIEGIRAFNEMRDDLMKHLRPFAQEGKEVAEADIRAFFDARIRGQQAS